MQGWIAHHQPSQLTAESAPDTSDGHRSWIETVRLHS